MKRRVIGCLIVAVLVASACGAKGADEAAEKDQATKTTEATTDGTTAAEGSTAKFGTLDSPCGKGDTTATIKADEAGAGTDKLYIGVGNDREGLRPGLLKELWDGANAFVNWCNEQGGINGLLLEAVDLNGEVIKVEDAMTKACTGVFAIVGGGWAQDNFIFSGRDGSDFHKCKMIAFPGFAVSTDFSEGTDQVQALPNPAYDKPASAMTAIAELYPDEVKKFGVVFGNLPSLVQNKDQIVGVAKQLDGYEGFQEISYDIISQDWAVVAQQVIDKDIQAISFVGEPPNMSKFSQALRDQGFEGVISADANQYDERLLEASGPAAVEGIVIRIAAHPFEEADKWPATGQLVKVLDDTVPDWTRAGLAVQSFSSALLFATAAKKCADEGEISRACVLQAGLDTHEWDAGGLHAVSDPGANAAPDCAMLVTVKGGQYERLFPELGSDEDNGEGFYCSPTVKLTGEFGTGNRESSILG